MTYLDNSATSYPKPVSVINAVRKSLTFYGANSGRGGYELSNNTAEKVFRTRANAARFFGAESPENVIFMPNCTHALNTVIKGAAQAGGHFVISCLEHNAVVRPLEALRQKGIAEYSTAEVFSDDEETVKSFKSKIKSDTKAIIVTFASNVFGIRLPVKKLSKLAHEYGLLLIADAAQAAGVVDIDVKRDGIDCLCVAAHKGLYAPMGAGLLIINCSSEFGTLIEGGTGSLSESAEQPGFLPDRFESGTLSVPLICGIDAGIDFVRKRGVNKIHTHEKKLMSRIYSELKMMDGVELYTDFDLFPERYLPIIPFNIKTLHSQQTAELLARDGVCVRAGFHCAYSAHKFYGTQDRGTVRISPSIFTNNKDINILLNSIFKIAKSI